MLARLVTSLRQGSDADAEQRSELDGLLVVPAGERTSPFDQLRKPPARVSGPSMVKALDRVSSIFAVGVGTLDLTAVPQRRVLKLAKYGLGGKAPALRRRPAQRRSATMPAAVHHLETKATDDALELLDVLMVTGLLARRPGVEQGEATAVSAVFEGIGEAGGRGGGPVRGHRLRQEVTLDQLWESIEAIVSRGGLADAVHAAGRRKVQSSCGAARTIRPRGRYLRVGRTGPRSGPRTRRRS